MIGVQEPRIWSAPEYVSSAGQEAIDLAAMAGLHLDPWQQFQLTHALGERADGKWAASTVGSCEPRQNGKGGIIEARQLAGMYLFRERLQVYSAHLFDTSLEAFKRLTDLVEGRDELTRRVKRISRAHGEEGIELYGPPGKRRSGTQRIRFRTRTKGGGRGFSGDCVYFDEAMIFPAASHAAILPILSARTNPQAWYFGSAVDQLVHEDGLVFARIRASGLKGSSRLAWFEHSAAGYDRPDEFNLEVLTDEDLELLVASSNPAYGIRIMWEAVADEADHLDPRAFAVERLGIGDWPSLEEGADATINLGLWRSLRDPISDIEGAPVFVYDVSPDREMASIGFAGEREDGAVHVEVAERRRGTGWLALRAVELRDELGDVRWICDGASQAASLVSEFDKHGIDVEVATAKDMADACARFYDLVVRGAEALAEGVVDGLRHTGQVELEAAIKGAKKRPLGERWAWSRKSSTVDITPLITVTLAAWGVDTMDEDIGVVAVDVEEEIRAKRDRAGAKR